MKQNMLELLRTSEIQEIFRRNHVNRVYLAGSHAR
jgi:hypothetical protein